MTRLLLLALLSGCASFERPMTRLAGDDMVCVRPFWQPSQEAVQAQCHNVEAGGCLIAGQAIIAVKPTSWSDVQHLQILGEELMHALGASHD